MTDHIAQLKRYIAQKQHHIHRRDAGFTLAETFAAQNTTPMRRTRDRFVALLHAETPVLLPGERIAMTRTIRDLPPLYTAAEWSQMQRERGHEVWNVGNINPGYAPILASGLAPVREKALARMRDPDRSPESREFYAAVAAELDAVFDLTDRYRALAESKNNAELAALFTRLPRQGATTFHEALQLFRILHFLLWLEGNMHNTIGRFDQYMYPYFEADIRSGRLTEPEAFELLEEFFLTFNRDSDLYPGVQRGDNGQSLVLGGVDAEGNPCFNRLSELCLRASCELRLIDPKINLRVDKNTPMSVYELGTELTRAGLGFPQYANDDVVIPGLVRLGYDLRDARDYVVAACWEFIIPRYGMEVPNIDALCYPKIVESCMHRDLSAAQTFDDFMDRVRAELAAECRRLAENTRGFSMTPSPYISIFMDDCLEAGRDVSQGAKYNNFGFHGVGIATAADSLAAIRQLVFEEKSLDAASLISAVDADFEGHDALLHRLRYEMPKMGNDDDRADALAVSLMDAFADGLQGLRNDRGGIFRPGTGSAMYYLWQSAEIGASPDGRRRGEPFGANYAPSLFARLDGPLSVIRSFTKPDFRRVINGGPLTMEFHDTLFRDPESIRNIASLVMAFIHGGGHQLQLNAVNRETLLDAQAHPENHENLIVRVWGWSAYFTALDKGFQDHVIQRQEYA